jgi:hypothetical protein
MLVLRSEETTMRAPTKESPSELRRPEIRRDRIAQRLAGLRAPDLSKIERPNIDMQDIDLSKIDLSKIDLPKIDFPHIDVSKSDVSKAIVGVATTAGLVRPRRRRWPYLLGGAVIVGLIGRAVMNSAAARERLTQGAQWARERIAEMREDREPVDEVAFTAAPTAPIDDGGFAGGSTDDPWASKSAADDDYPEGLGAPDKKDTAGDRIPVFKEVDSPAVR